MIHLVGHIKRLTDGIKPIRLLDMHYNHDLMFLIRIMEAGAIVSNESYSQHRWKISRFLCTSTNGNIQSPYLGKHRILLRKRCYVYLQVIRMVLLNFFSIAFSQLSVDMCVYVTLILCKRINFMFYGYEFYAYQNQSKAKRMDNLLKDSFICKYIRGSLDLPCKLENLFGIGLGSLYWYCILYTILFFFLFICYFLHFFFHTSYRSCCVDEHKRYFPIIYSPPYQFKILCLHHRYSYRFWKPKWSTNIISNWL